MKLLAELAEAPGDAYQSSLETLPHKEHGVEIAAISRLVTVQLHQALRQPAGVREVVDMQEGVSRHDSLIVRAALAPIGDGHEAAPIRSPKLLRDIALAARILSREVKLELAEEVHVADIVLVPTRARHSSATIPVDLHPVLMLRRQRPLQPRIIIGPAMAAVANHPQDEIGAARSRARSMQQGGQGGGAPGQLNRVPPIHAHGEVRLVQVMQCPVD
mmetsp:Transcript_26788/g.60332  ORF Transcript_26788/g.60332 Transcript_26788/m.60332 type:complete len:217 (+) Transcript_26788:157-807(+)